MVHLSFVDFWRVCQVALIAAIVVPRLRERYGSLTMGVLSLAVAATAVAKVLRRKAGGNEPLPERHSDLGHILLTVAAVLLASSGAWWLLFRRRDRIGFVQPDLPERIAGGTSIVLSVAARRPGRTRPPHVGLL